MTGLKQLWVLGMVVCCCLAAQAEDELVFTGKVVRVHSGQKATFYNVVTTDGQQLMANSAWKQIAENEEALKQAYESGCNLRVRYLPHPSHANSIWKILSLEVVASDGTP